MRIVILSHEDSRTGAPILLLNLAKILKTDNHEVIFIIRRSVGHLFSSFSELAPTYLASWSYKPKRIGRNILKELGNYKRWKVAAEFIKKADFILSNTITNGEFCAELSQWYNIPIATYIHELGISPYFITPTSSLNKVWAQSKAFFFPCKTVQLFYQENFGIKASDSYLLPYFIAHNQHINKTDLNASTDDLDTFVVGGSGTVNWRKGTDTMVQLAKTFTEEYPDKKIRFVWKGVEKGSVELLRLEYDIKMAGLQNVFLLLALDDDMEGFYRNIHLFLLTSHEDPYPLVVLEAAQYGKPSICFDTAGGMPDFIEDDAGFAVPYLSVSAMSKKIVEYMDNRALLASHSKCAMEKVAIRHSDPELILRSLFQILPALNKA